MDSTYFPMAELKDGGRDKVLSSECGLRLCEVLRSSPRSEGAAQLGVVGRGETWP